MGVPTAIGAAGLVLALGTSAYPATPGGAAPVSTAPSVRTAASATPDGDGPSGFWYGTDSTTVTVSGSAPYRMPVIGGRYGGYIGMIGNWAQWQGCHGKVVWSSTNSAQANKNYTSYHSGIGTGAYWFMGGPGVDPHYSGTAAESYAWGKAQAAHARYYLDRAPLTYRVVFMDIEIPGNAPSFTPAPDNGWNSVYTSPCSGQVRQNYVPAVLDRATFNGFWDYLKHHTSFIPGVYSAPDIWHSIFGNTSYGSIPGTDEWTYEAFTSSLSNPPYGFCLRGTSTCAHFFGGVSRSSRHAVMWQWSGGGGSRNGYGDFDQIDANRQG